MECLLRHWSRDEGQTSGDINKRGHRSSLLFLGSEFDVIERLVKLIYNHTFHLTFNVE